MPTLAPLRCFIALSATAALLATAAGSAEAAMLAPGGIAALSGTTAAADPALGGVVRSDVLHPFEIHDGAGNVVLTGNLQDRVAESAVLGTAWFAPRLRDTALTPGGPTVAIIGMRLEGYGDYTSDVEYRTDGSGDVGPNVASRSVDGDLITLRYTADPLLPPEESYFPSILTDAPGFEAFGTATIIAQDLTNDEVYTVRLEGLNSPVPEPSTAVLALGAMAGLIARRR